MAENRQMYRSITISNVSFRTNIFLLFELFYTRDEKPTQIIAISLTL